MIKTCLLKLKLLLTSWIEKFILTIKNKMKRYKAHKTKYVVHFIYLILILTKTVLPTGNASHCKWIGCCYVSFHVNLNTIFIDVFTLKVAQVQKMRYGGRLVISILFLNLGSLNHWTNLLIIFLSSKFHIFTSHSYFNHCNTTNSLWCPN